MRDIDSKKTVTPDIPDIPETSDTPKVLPLEDPKVPDISFTSPKKSAAILIIVCILGVATGYLIYMRANAGVVRLSGRAVEVVKTNSEEGVRDASTFRDTATGTLAENDGKITNEGSHILVRGDPSQNAYLTSSVIDLGKYVGKKVQVWGETFKGQKAGWLMDVGRIKVL